MPNSIAPIARFRFYSVLAVSLFCAVGFYAWSHRGSLLAKHESNMPIDQQKAGSSEPISAGELPAGEHPGSAMPTNAQDQRQAKSNQPSAPVIESPEVIASMDIEFVRDEVERVERELESRKAIERLNNGEASEAERLEFGAMMQRVALLRHRLLEDSVDSLSQSVAEYEKSHATRVAEYSKKLGRR
jgi:hypothetical protein